MTYLVDLHLVGRKKHVGEKAHNLYWLSRHGYRIPQTWVLPYAAWETYRREPANFMESLRSELETWLVQLKRRPKPPSCFAVRSSANLEDNTSHSFAGQFTSCLNVSASVEALVEAVQQVFNAGASSTVKAYSKQTGQDLQHLRLAVLIQEMVTPVISGVVFSKNPLTGLDEVIVEAIPGTGAQLVGEGKTPERWVYKWGSWIARPESSSIDLHLIDQVVSQTQQIARQYSRPVDLEWVYDGHDLQWVQVRPMTQWESIPIYSNRISREMFPGLIKPLVWTVNVPLVNSAWIQLLTEMIGANDLRPEALAKCFYSRAYFNMGVMGEIFQMLGFPRESLELLLGYQSGPDKPRFKPSSKTFRLVPRLLGFSLNKLRVGSDVMPALQRSRAKVDQLLSQPLDAFDEAGLLAQIDRLYQANQEIVYLNIILPLLMSIYHSLFSRQLARLGVDFATFDLARDLRELEEFDPNLQIRHLAQAYNCLDQPTRESIAGLEYQAFLERNGMDEFQIQIVNFLEQFGHLSDSGNDFSSLPWRENPGLVLQMIVREAVYLQTKQCDEVLIKTHIKERGETVPEDPPQKLAWEDLPLSRFQRLRLQPLYQRTRKFRLYREASSATYTYAYGLFRHYFLELGRRLVQRSVLVDEEDIFFLEWSEVRAVVTGSGLPGKETAASLAARRRAELHTNRDLALPELIYGDELAPPRPPEWQGASLKGIPSSRGYYTGPVKVIRMLTDFEKLSPGDVLVIPYSDVSWTPLFSRAGAVVAEAGGILSHSSIIAREYNLPCVVSVPHACQIADDTIVTVDGYKGEVILESNE